MSNPVVEDLSISMKDVIPSAIRSLNAGQSDNSLMIPHSLHVVVLLIDGLGELQLRNHAPDAPILHTGSLGFMTTEFPSTTPVVLGSLGTGLTPGRHGLVGASFWLPEDEQMFAPLKWGSIPHPLSIAPEKTLFEMARESGIDVATIAPSKHQQSGLTRSVLRGSSYHGANSPDEILNSFRARQSHLHANQPALTYIYWPDLDRLGHVFGAGSREWIDGLRIVNSLVTELVESLNKGESLVVTSDHGMITCPEESRIGIENHPSLGESLIRVGGEPRVRHVYVRDGSLGEVQATWQSVLDLRARVLTREESIDSGLFHVEESAIAQRIGDLVVIAMGNHMLTSSIDPLSSRLLGQHGADSAEESLVPLRIFDSDGSSLSR